MRVLDFVQECRWHFCCAMRVMHCMTYFYCVSLHRSILFLRLFDLNCDSAIYSQYILRKCMTWIVILWNTVNIFPQSAWLELRFYGKQSIHFLRVLDLNCAFMENSQHIPRKCMTWIAISWKTVNIFPENVWLELRFHGKQSTYSQEMFDLNCDFMENSQYISSECLTWIVILWKTVNISPKSACPEL